MSDENTNVESPATSEVQPAAVIPAAAPGSDESVADTLDVVIDVPLRLTVEMGTTRMLLREVLQLGKGSVVDLDRHPNDPVDILVNGRLIARGDLTNDEERLAVRIVELVQARDEAGSRR